MVCDDDFNGNRLSQNLHFPWQFGVLFHRTAIWDKGVRGKSHSPSKAELASKYERYLGHVHRAVRRFGRIDRCELASTAICSGRCIRREFEESRNAGGVPNLRTKVTVRGAHASPQTRSLSTDARRLASEPAPAPGAEDDLSLGPIQCHSTSATRTLRTTWTTASFVIT